MPRIQNFDTLSLFQGERVRFCEGDSVTKTIKLHVPEGTAGNYILWWMSPEKFPLQATVELQAGKRGVLPVLMNRPTRSCNGDIALYAGKGLVRNRLLSHFKEARTKEGKVLRNPYWWLSRIFPNNSIDRLIIEEIGFTFVPNADSRSQVYLENLSIGIFKPWFNMRLSA